MNIVEELYNQKLITPPYFAVNKLCLLCIGGSIAYKCNVGTSDQDIIGVCIPPYTYIHPTQIFGYDDIPVFDDYQQHHINYNGIEYDVKIYNITRIFKLAEDGNPNILDFILSSDETVLFQNEIGKYIRDNAHSFLSKQCVSKYLGFAKNHFVSMENRIKSGQYPEKRKHLFEQYGFDTKDISHCLRCMMSLKDMLVDGVYEPARYGDMMRMVRTGKYTYEQCKEMYQQLLTEIRSLEQSSTLREKPNHDFIRSILVKCLHGFMELGC